MVCDRFTASTLAYQGYGRGVSLEQISYVNTLATQGLIPSLAFLLDISPEISFGRKKGTAKDRIEREDLNFHKSVRQGYLDIAKSDSKLWTILDGYASETEVKDQIWHLVRSQLRLIDYN